MRNRQKNRYHTWRMACLYLPDIQFARKKACLVWRVKMNFISNKSLNNGTFSCFKHFLTPYRTRKWYENSKLPVVKSSFHMTRLLPLLYYSSLAKTESRLQSASINSLTPVPAVTGHAKTHPQFPVPAVTGHEKPCQDNCLSYPPWRDFGPPIVLLLLTHWLLHRTVRDPPQISWRFQEIFQSERKHKNKPYAQ